MKILKKLLLIHWHYFTRELIEFGGINFLTGKNASGKSTIIDAMQLLLLGDTSGNFFNKAASGRGNRTLLSYLKGELGDDENSGFHYLRNDRFTSYIVMEFYDDEKNVSFTAGCSFDIYSENDYQKLFFIYNDKFHPNLFLDDSNTPMDITALRDFLRKNYGSGRSETTDTNKEFRTKLYGRLGGLRERFADLLKKAVSFNPNVDIHQFISEFVCDNRQPVDISHMQENIRSYKRLDEETAVLRERISLLEKINKKHDDYNNAIENEKLYTFLIDRATADKKLAEIESTKLNIQKLIEELDQLTKNINNAEKEIAKLRKLRDTLNGELFGNSAMLMLEKIDREISEKERKINELQNNYDRAKRTFDINIAAWRSGIETMLQKMNAAKFDILQAGLASRIADICEESRGLLERVSALANSVYAKDGVNAILQIKECNITEFSGNADNLKKYSIELNYRLRDELESISKHRAELLAEQQSLENGIYRFPQDALDLKDAIISRLRTLAKRDVSVRIVAESADIKDNRWRNAIEGYLHTQKFYIIVPHEYFVDALCVFDAIKREKSVYGTGVVDIEKIRKQNPVAEAGSLAEEIDSDDADVKLFLDFILGSVKKCDDVKNLRDFRTSITDEGMLYRNFVVRAMHPDRFAKPAIGHGAIKRRLENVKNEISILTEQTAVCASVMNGLSAINKINILSDEDIEHILQSARNMSAIPELNVDLAVLKKDRDAIDTTAIDLLTTRIAAIDNNVDELTKKKDIDIATKGARMERCNVLRNKTIPTLENELQDLETKVTQYGEEWTAAKGMPRYSKELSARGKPDNIINAFTREQSKAINSKTCAEEELFELRREYNDKYKMGFNYKAKDNDEYYRIWSELNNNELPHFQERIKDAKAKAAEQFQEDFISRMQNNIKNTEQQIKDLNDALKNASFGEDTYRFRMTPKSDYKRYYDMIMDDMITQGGYNLFSTTFNAKYKEEIDDLFKIVTNEGGRGDFSECERRIHEFTDFRNYLSFDLEVTSKDGESQRLSKTLGKKSGGETQTPFYIAVLASFAQLYREGRDKTYKTTRLIIFDEAFSKMDGERIVRSIELLRKFKFQAILSAPSDKLADIGTLVDRNLCVLREGKHTCVKSFDPKQIMEATWS